VGEVRGSERPQIAGYASRRRGVIGCVGELCGSDSAATRTRRAGARPSALASRLARGRAFAAHSPGVRERTTRRAEVHNLDVHPPDLRQRTPYSTWPQTPAHCARHQSTPTSEFGTSDNHRLFCNSTPTFDLITIYTANHISGSRTTDPTCRSPRSRQGNSPSSNKPPPQFHAHQIGPRTFTPPDVLHPLASSHFFPSRRLWIKANSSLDSQYIM
jgi:hypothetical protein